MATVQPGRPRSEERRHPASGDYSISLPAATLAIMTPAFRCPTWLAQSFAVLPVASGMPLTRELEHFIDCVRMRAEPRTSGEEAVGVLRILTAGTVTHS